MKNPYTFIVFLLLVLFNISCNEKESAPAAPKLTVNVQKEKPDSYSLDTQVEFDSYSYNFSALSDDAAEAILKELHEVATLEYIAPASDFPIGFDSYSCTLSILTDDSPEALFKELQEASTFEYIASASGFLQEELNCICLVFGSDKVFERYNVNLYLTDSNLTNNNIPVFKTISKILEIYTRERLNGHTKKYITSVLNSDTDSDPVNNPELKDLFRIYPDILHSWVKKVSEEEVELQEGTGRQVNFVIIDGDIAWRYPILYNPDGTVEECLWDSGRCDAKEYDSKYKQIIEEAERFVDEKMEHENITGIGACYTFWEWKKEYLKKKGVDWKSPSDLNPGAMYD